VTGHAAARAWAVLVAAGRGSRMKAERPKQYLPLAGKPVLCWSLDLLLDTPWLDGVVVVLNESDQHFASLPQSRHPKLILANGGAERADSVLAGLAALRARGAIDTDRVYVHDAARPCLLRTDLDALREEAVTDDGALLAAPLSDTLKRGDSGLDTGDRVQTTEPRERLWRALTPQCFALGLLGRALTEALAAGVAVTDESSAMEHAGYRPRLVSGAPDNLKITLPSDLLLAEAILRARRRPEDICMRTGHGYDLHRLEAGHGLVVGGVHIDCEWRVIAHSDGDVAIHALCDALLGAAGLGDIGRHFPDTDPAWAGADSRGLLRTVVARLAEAGWAPLNVDVSVVAQVPKLAPHIERMRERLAADLGLETDAVNLKATTHEGVDAIGEKRAIAAHAVCLLRQQRAV
jgi:2-C-methyl-D-erythritol 4-phosphate cytidylyltransferase/2-C-methyl-D-erythritol 2,4-cyclodiphosphate synthase